MQEKKATDLRPALLVNIDTKFLIDTTEGEIYHVHELEDSILRWQFTPNWSVDSIKYQSKFQKAGTSLVAQCLRIRLPMQGSGVRTLVREDPTCRRATKPVRHNYWACVLEPANHNYWARVPQLLKPTHLEPMLRNEKPPQWEARAPQRRVAPAHRN